MQLEKLGLEHVNVAARYHNFASIKYALGDLEQAKEFQQIGDGVIHQDKSSFVYTSVAQYNWTWSAYNLNKSCDFQSYLIFHTPWAIFWLEIRFV